MRIATVALCMLLFSALVWAGIFRDDFEDGDLDGWQLADEGGDGKAEERGGELMVTDVNRSLATLVFFNNGQNLKDFQLTVDGKMAKSIDNNPYMWIVWRATDTVLAFNGYGPGDPIWISVITRDFRFFGTAKIPFVFEIGRWYHIKLEMKKAQVTLWVDGKLIREVDWKNQPLSKSGKVGLGGGGAEVHFDNFVITG
ncbi:MAG: family 16 glycoside hydrolase, partial [Candidatus Poribacteria bacterium]